MSETKESSWINLLWIALGIVALFFIEKAFGALRSMFQNPHAFGLLFFVSLLFGVVYGIINMLYSGSGWTKFFVVCVIMTGILHFFGNSIALIYTIISN
jgi:FtsH-binding integral membrane protein